MRAGGISLGLVRASIPATSFAATCVEAARAFVEKRRAVVRRPGGWRAFHLRRMAPKIVSHNYTPESLLNTSKSLLAVGIVALLCASAQAEVFPRESMLKADRKEAAGGKGTLSGEYAFTRDKARKDEAIKEISWLTLPPGDSIGYHKHISNEDTYVIVSGQGLFKDSDGKDHPVKAGDVTIVRKGESHGLANTGKEPLVFIDVIAEQ